MKVKDLQEQLGIFRQHFGNVEVEFLLYEEELEFVKIHDGYNATLSGMETVCEIRLKQEG